jgi:hypothetical protein
VPAAELRWRPGVFMRDSRSCRSFSAELAGPRLPVAAAKVVLSLAIERLAALASARRG